MLLLAKNIWQFESTSILILINLVFHIQTIYFVSHFPSVFLNMGRLGLFCFMVILAEILVVQAMAGKSEGSELNPFGLKAQNKVGTLRVVARLADQPVSSVAESPEGSNVAEAPEIRRLGKHHSDKSVAGGGVIIGGLVTAIFAAVFCYIRVTRKRGDVH